MRRALKYTLSALAAAVVAAPAMAGNVVDNTAVWGALTYTEASGNGLNFAQNRIANDAGGEIWRHLFVEPDHEADFSAGISFRIAGHNTRVFLEYDHFKSDEDRRVSGNNVAALGLNENALGVQVDSTVEHKERDFKLGLRHTLDFGPKFEMVVGGGLEYDKIERRHTIRAFDLVGGGDSHYLEAFNESEGWGPFVEAKGRAYPWGASNRCWSFWMRGALALLYSDHTGTFLARDGNAANPVLLDENSRYPEDSKSILTRIEADMGVEWNRVMRADFNDLMLGVKLGLRYHNITNAIKNTNTLMLVAPNSVSGEYDSRDNDFGRMGPFLEFKIGGAHA